MKTGCQEHTWAGQEDSEVAIWVGYLKTYLSATHPLSKSENRFINTRAGGERGSGVDGWVGGGTQRIAPRTELAASQL